MGALTQWLILEVLGLRIRLEPDTKALERLKARSDWQQAKPCRPRRRWGLREIAASRRRNAPWLFSPETAREAGRKSAMMRRIGRQKAAAVAEATIVA
jgi:hypothetical protein